MMSSEEQRQRPDRAASTRLPSAQSELHDTLSEVQTRAGELAEQAAARLEAMAQQLDDELDDTSPAPKIFKAVTEAEDNRYYWELTLKEKKQYMLRYLQRSG